jgi:hypothetical protein
LLRLCARKDARRDGFEMHGSPRSWSLGPGPTRPSLAAADEQRVGSRHGACAEEIGDGEEGLPNCPAHLPATIDATRQ